MKACQSPPSVCINKYMGDKVTARYLEALALLPLTKIAEGTGQAYPTLQAYKYGERRVTTDAARKLATFLRDRAAEFEQVAEALEAAIAAEESDG